VVLGYGAWDMDDVSRLSDKKYGYRLPFLYAVVQLDEALRYKPEGRGFDSRWCQWNISFT
jgi:hypothetical protein